MLKLKLWGKMVSAELRSQMQFRLSFVFESLATILISVAEFSAIALVLPNFGSIGGWTLGEIAFLYGTVNFSFGLMDMLFSGFDPGDFGNKVRLGRFDQLLLRPVDITLQVFGSRLLVKRLGRIGVGLGIIMIALLKTSIVWSASKLILLVLTVFGQVLFFGGLFIIGSTITFWTIDSIEVINIFTYGGSELISYPMHIYPNPIRKFFTFVLPAIFLNYYPAIYILELQDPLNMPEYSPWLSPLAGLLIIWIALRFWHFGISKYQSTGT